MTQSKLTPAKMSNIRVATQILDDHMGGGRADNYEAAQRLATFMKSAWRVDLAGFVAAGHEIEIDIDVWRDTSGYARPVRAIISGCGHGEASDLALAVERALTPYVTLWEQFCKSDGVNPLS